MLWLTCLQAVEIVPFATKSCMTIVGHREWVFRVAGWRENG